QHHKFASGVIVKNVKGEVLVSKLQLHTGVGSTFAVEALVCLKAVVSGVGRGDSGRGFQVAFLVTLIGEWRWGGQGNQIEASLLKKE
ncbi:hypothetical protein Gorai_004230, partial [Gossypium raimondii]|nr:hypothetical protein [Gossypium raimondii]